jgi:hypothetical protein
MATKKEWVVGAALVLMAALALAACSGKKEGGTAAAGVAGAVGKTVKAVVTPATDFSYDLSEDGKGVVITNYTGKGGAVVIPGEIEGYPVVEIGGAAFLGWYNGNRYASADIVSLVLPESVVKINASAFAAMGKLISVNFPAGLKTISSNAFLNCIELANLEIPESLKSLNFTDGYPNDADNGAFEACKKLPLATRKKIQDLGYKGEI